MNGLETNEVANKVSDTVVVSPAVPPEQSCHIVSLGGRSYCIGTWREAEEDPHPLSAYSKQYRGSLQPLTSPQVDILLNSSGAKIKSLKNLTLEAAPGGESARGVWSALHDQAKEGGGYRI